MDNINKAIKLVLEHNRLLKSTEIVSLLLEGLTPKEVCEVLKVSLPQVYRIRSKYIKEEV